MPPGEPVRLLTVCTGNICRSPYAEVLLRDGLESAPGCRQRRPAARRQEQAVVLAMATEHKELVLDEAPGVHRRTFTLRELARVLDEIGERHDWAELLAGAGADDVASRWRALPGLVAAHRDRGRARRADRDVADPYARGDRAFDRMVAEVDPAVRSIVMWERQFAR